MFELRDNSALAASKRREELMAPEKLSNALPTPTVSAKTDADSRRRLSLPADQHWVLFARAGRPLAGEREDYVWIVGLPPQQGASTTLSLSNDNLLLSGNDPRLEARCKKGDSPPVKALAVNG